MDGYYRSFSENLQTFTTDIPCKISELFRTAIRKNNWVQLLPYSLFY